MKAITPLFVFLWIGITTQAQPIVNTAIIPDFQDSIHLIQCATAELQESASGANQNWDFSGLTPGIEPDFYFKFLDPALTPFGNRYPRADLVAINADSQYAYYELEGGILQTVGVASDVPNIGLAFGDYNDPEYEEVFPIRFGDRQTDEFDGVNLSGGFSTPFNGTVEREVDGYGTLILPSGTFNNVLRIKEERVVQIQGAPDPITSTLYRFVSADYQLWLLSMESFPNRDPLIYYRDSPSIITSNQEVESLAAIHIYPNPVYTGTPLHIQTDEQAVQGLQLYHASGKVIPVQISSGPSSTWVLHLPDHLAPGIYWLNGLLSDGLFSEKIMIATHPH